ncbi:MAG: DUF3160 domain-containing protein [Spirochaetales bacterium]|nr:DUF3160 domain-containing protein [Spirochaetales bacterium]
MRKFKKPMMAVILLILGGLIFAQPASVCGDINRDGTANIVDAMLIAQHYVGMSIELDVQAADVNSDGAVNIVDSLNIAQFYVKLVASLNCSSNAGLLTGITKEESDYLEKVESKSSELLNISASEFLDQYRPDKSFTGVLDPHEASYYDEMVQTFNLTESQTALIRDNGFVLIPQEQYGGGFGLIYREVFRNDLPVYVSADSILEPLFRSYDSLLSMLESKKLVPQLSDILTNTLDLAVETGEVSGLSDNMSQAIADVQFYLGLALALLQDSIPGQVPAELVTKIDYYMQSIVSETMQDIDFLGKSRMVDFSQFKPRGHYTCSSSSLTNCPLTRFFKAMMWLGRADCAFYLDETRQLRAFFLLYDFLAKSNSIDNINDFNSDISFFVGNIDGFSLENMMTFWSVEKENLSISDVINNDAKAGEAQALLENQNYGNQYILSQAMWKSPEAERPDLPKIAQLSGQRFILDSFLLGQTVEGYVAARNKPLLEEVAFCLGNNAALNVIRDDIFTYNITKLPTYKPLYARLGAARSLFDYYPHWDNNLYTLWLNSLRQLSNPLPDTVPAAMRTLQWQEKQMNTQLASWAQLRHNTILYAKQSYSIGVTCFYPDGYVDPYPEFYRTIGALMKRMGERLNPSISYLTSFFNTWQDVTKNLADIAETELQGLPLTTSQLNFLNNMLVLNPSNVCGAPEYKGWYANIFYSGWSEAINAKPVIADVHTIPSSIYSPSNMVLHGATGRPMLMILHAYKENESCGSLYAGPVFSFYQQDVTPIARMSNEEWMDILKKSNPQPPMWLQKYMGFRGL